MGERNNLKKMAELILVLLALLPLFLLNIKSSHDWGDDFAQYIHQAKNLTEGISQNNTGYIFNTNCFTGPIAYPVGFPLILSPIVKTWGLDFYRMNQLQTFFLLLSCVLGFLMLRHYLSFWSSFFIALMIAYNPMLLNFKTEIISDLPFTALSMLCLFLMQRQLKWSVALLLGVLMALVLHIRSVGLLLPAVFIFQQVFLVSKPQNFSFQTQRQTWITLLTFLIVYLGIKWRWPCETNYPGIFETEHFWHSINEHLSYNLYHLSMFFRGYPIENYWSIGLMASAALMAFAFFGFFHFASANKKSIYVIYVPVYLLMVISYKYSHAGMRFLYPVLFFIFLFAAIGIKKMVHAWLPKPAYLAPVFGILVLFSYHEEVWRIQERENEVPDGPMRPAALAAFAYINTHLPTDAVVAFDKPRALCLYTHVKSFAIYPAANHDAIAKDLKTFKATYYLSHVTQSTENIATYPQTVPEQCRLMYQNSDFKLFEIQPAAH